MAKAELLLSVRNLKKHFPIKKGFISRVVGNIKAVDGVSFDVPAGQCVGLVGESGCGKTTVGRTILRAQEPTAGEILFRVDGREHDLAKASAEELKALRRHAQMIFQDPYASLNPRMTVFELVGEPLLINGLTNRDERLEKVRALLTKVGLKGEHLQRYPHAFSGGQRQRIGIARALALNPKLIVADEPVSALDVSVQAQVLNLLMDLQRELKLAYLFVSHELSVVRHICDRVLVMYAGQIVEDAPVDGLFDRPLHPYTAALLAAVPIPDPKRRGRRILLSGEVADPSKEHVGCRFAPRCPYAQARCREEAPELQAQDGERQVRCHLAATLDLNAPAPAAAVAGDC